MTKLPFNRVLHWFTREWWRYLLEAKAEPEDSWFTVIRCRAKGHPAGVVWHNIGALEPDMHCRGCGDDLG